MADLLVQLWHTPRFLRVLLPILALALMVAAMRVAALDAGKPVPRWVRRLRPYHTAALVGLAAAGALGVVYSAALWLAVFATDRLPLVHRRSVSSDGLAGLPAFAALVVIAAVMRRLKRAGSARAVRAE